MIVCFPNAVERRVALGRVKKVRLFDFSEVQHSTI